MQRKKKQYTTPSFPLISLCGGVFFQLPLPSERGEQKMYFYTGKETPPPPFAKAKGGKKIPSSLANVSLSPPPSSPTPFASAASINEKQTLWGKKKKYVRVFALLLISLCLLPQGLNFRNPPGDHKVINNCLLNNEAADIV